MTKINLIFFLLFSDHEITNMDAASYSVVLATTFCFFSFFLVNKVIVKISLSFIAGKINYSFIKKYFNVSVVFQQLSERYTLFKLSHCRKKNAQNPQWLWRWWYPTPFEKWVCTV